SRKGDGCWAWGRLLHRKSADGPALARLSALVADGRLTLRVADTLPLEQAAHAHRRLEAGGLRGRLLLTP
ncbi:zinc-binding dehydrogenase, partial [Kitasatospora sp. NPDC036755]|uniref:zinc-binding dehydrogenase n=1 Tax=Kitasatospora sp. NPDC036755 TaxID=3154600 RepID=UPI0033D58425